MMLTLGLTRTRTGTGKLDLVISDTTIEARGLLRFSELVLRPIFALPVRKWMPRYLSFDDAPWLFPRWSLRVDMKSSQVGKFTVNLCTSIGKKGL